MGNFGKGSKGRPPVRHHVREWRKHRHLSQERLAERINKSRGLISQIEIGETELTEPNIYALAEALGCDPGDLLDVDPTIDSELIDITFELKKASPEAQAEAIGYIRGILSRKKA